MPVIDVYKKEFCLQRHGDVRAQRLRAAHSASVVASIEQRRCLVAGKDGKHLVKLVFHPLSGA